MTRSLVPPLPKGAGDRGGGVAPSGFHRESPTPDPRNCDPGDSPDRVPGDTLSERPQGFIASTFVIRPGGRPCRTLNPGPVRGSAPAATCDAARGTA